MADLTFNKIAGAALATGLVIFGLQNLVSEAFKTEPPKTPGYAIAVVDTGESGGEAPDVLPDWGTVLPKADIAKGKAVTDKCASCHQFDPADTPGTGPGLFGVVGRQPGSQPKYTTYDSAMHDFETAPGHTAWTYDLLYQFLKAPGQFMPGTKMTFVGLKDPQDRINVIAYLRSNGSPTFPIPAPAPAKAAAPAAGATNATAPATNATAPATNAASPAANATAPATNATAAK